MRRLQTAVGVFYLVGAICWITNASWELWPSGNQLLDDYLIGVTAVVGAALFHAGAMCQLWEALNTHQPATAAFTRLPVSAPAEPWLDHHQQQSQQQQAGLFVPSSLNSYSCSSMSSVTSATPLKGLQLDHAHHHQSAHQSDACCHHQHAFITDLNDACDEDASGAIAITGADGLTSSAHTTAALGDSSSSSSTAGHASHHNHHNHPAAAGGSSPVGGSPRSVFSTEQHSTPEPPSSTTQGSLASVIIRQLSFTTRPNRRQRWHEPGSGTAGPEQQQHTCVPDEAAAAVAAVVVEHRTTGRRWRGGAQKQQQQQQEDWVWWEWRPHHRSFMAAFVQVVGTTIFLAACLCGFPGVLPTNYAAGDWVYWDAFFWSPFLLGSCLFISSALLSLRDCQDCWWSPKPRLRLWWMHLSNTVGSIGFWLCSFFGLFAHPAEKFQRWGMAFSCLWGSCCFAIAAYLQLLQVCCWSARAVDLAA